MKFIEVSTQEEFDKAIAPGVKIIVKAGFFIARGNSSVEARENSSVEAWGNSSVEARENSSVEARGNSSVVAWENSSVEAWGNSSVVAWENSSVEAWGNSSVVARGNSSVVARGNSSVVAWENSSVVAWENSSVEARGNVFIRLFSALKIKASAHVVIMKHGNANSIRGGVKVDAMKIKTFKDWCEFYGVKIVKGFVTLFKALDDDFVSPHGASYKPGSTPEAPDWDGGKRECGGGLHFSPSPIAAKAFNGNATKFAACPINIKDIAIHPDGSYPEKVKAKRVAKPCYEVNKHGERI